MKKVILFIATSIDGYIADPDGGVEWLDKLQFIEGEDHGYYDFVSGIDTMVTGRKTYEFVQNAGVEWPYPGIACHVVTRNRKLPITTPDTYIVTDPLDKLMSGLREKKGKDIWLVGGGELCTAFLELDLIDEIWLTVIPVALGKGIPLFAGGYQESWYELNQITEFGSGSVTLHYSRKKDH